MALGGCGPSSGRRTAHKNRLVELTPAPLRATSSENPEVTVARLRVYADGPYRGQNPAWQRQLGAIVERANAVLEPSLGLRLEVAEAKPWERSGSANELDPMLKELETLDTGADVDWVIGLVNALPNVTTSIHKLGLARPFGKHIVVRGLNDAAEVALLEAALDALEPAERQELYTARKRHKETVLLLHEIAHTLASVHVSDPKLLLHADYSERQSSFAPETLALMRVVVASRRRGDPERTTLKAVSEHLESAKWQGWQTDELAQLIAFLEREVKLYVEAGPSAVELGEAVRPADRRTYREIVALASAGKRHEAWEALEPLLGFYPDEPGIRMIACEIAMERDPKSPASMGHCMKAAELLTDDPRGDIAVARAKLAAGDRAAALSAAGKARKKLEGRDNAAAIWGKLAALYRKLDAVTWAEEAAGKGKDKGVEIVSVWAARQRARFALPPKAERYKIKPELEAEYLAAIKALLKMVYANKFVEAKRSAAQLERKFRGAPGIPAVLCDLEIRQRNYGAARRLCNRALKTFDGSSWAHYLSGLLDKREKKVKRAAAHLERAIALDRELRHAYSVLKELYESSGDKDALERLKQSFNDAFPGQTLH